MKYQLEPIIKLPGFAKRYVNYRLKQSDEYKVRAIWLPDMRR
jgi:hypothetical protein